MGTLWDVTGAEIQTGKLQETSEYAGGESDAEQEESGGDRDAEQEESGGERDAEQEESGGERDAEQEESGGERDADAEAKEGSGPTRGRDGNKAVSLEEQEAKIQETRHGPGGSWLLKVRSLLGKRDTKE
ncbi:hypothetical protein NDU88_006271 [Pleurodeles waltl]|uniref:Uncharacterized protein n=1 Tax=Pleurodeles waltl TaxID=8319 RepID=A0AAV7PMZ5_PLEWA|nr:hypothetical protein NDU88_006271 [Pleurodeles waltl]